MTKAREQRVTLRLTLSKSTELRMRRLMKAAGAQDEARLVRMALAAFEDLVDHVNDGGRVVLLRAQTDGECETIIGCEYRYYDPIAKEDADG